MLSEVSSDVCMGEGSQIQGATVGSEVSSDVRMEVIIIFLSRAGSKNHLLVWRRK